MAQDLRFFRTTTVPTLPAEASAVYIVAEAGMAADEADIYFTNTDGTAMRSTLTHADAVTKIEDALSTYSNLMGVADMDARDALVMTSSAMVLVADPTTGANPDTTVNSGAAMYFYDHTEADPLLQWTKIYEAESLDLTLTWGNIVGQPNVTKVEVETAVANTHTHNNLPILNGIDTLGGFLRYNNYVLNGNPVLVENQW